MNSDWSLRGRRQKDDGAFKRCRGIESGRGPRQSDSIRAIREGQTRTDEYRACEELVVAGPVKGRVELEVGVKGSAKAQGWQGGCVLRPVAA